MKAQLIAHTIEGSVVEGTFEGTDLRDVLRQAFIIPTADINDPSVAEDLHSIVDSFRKVSDTRLVDDNNEELQYTLEIMEN